MFKSRDLLDNRIDIMVNRRLEEKTISNLVHIYLETQNLLVRQYTMNDIDGLYEIMSNPQVHQYTKDRNCPWDRRKTEQCIQFFMEWIKVFEG